MPNLDDIMKMAQDAQAKLMQAQEDLDKVEVEGVSGGGLVKIRATRQGPDHRASTSTRACSRRPRSRWSRIWSPPRSTTPAARPIRRRQGAMPKMTGGLQLPPGFKLPF